MVTKYNVIFKYFGRTLAVVDPMPSPQYYAATIPEVCLLARRVYSRASQERNFGIDG